MKKKLSLMVELDDPTLAYLDGRFDVVRFSKAEPGRDDAADEEETLAHIARVKPEVAIIEQEPFTVRVIEAAAPELRFIASVRAAPNNVDVAAGAARGIVVTNAPGRNAVAVVEMTIGFMICLARFIPQTHHELMCRRLTIKPGTPTNTKDILWQHPDLARNPYVLYRGIELDGRILGLVGFGIIGAQLAAKAGALGMRVIVFDPYVDAGRVEAVGAEKVEFDDLVKTADFVSLHAKVTPDTRGMFGKEQFAMMKPEAYFINTARGALVVQEDLCDALRERRIAGAALDVYDREPQYDDSPLFDLDNVVLTPHIGGATKDGIKHQSRLVLDNIKAYLEGAEPPNLVRP